MSDFLNSALSLLIRLPVSNQNHNIDSIIELNPEL